MHHAGTRTPPLTRRAFGLGTLAVGAISVSAGCGSAADEPPAGSGARPADGEDFPVTVPGDPGAAVVKAAPQRVFAAGFLRDTDLALALGANLVGLVSNVAIPGGIAPWQRVGKDVTRIESASGSLPYEQVAALRPDLILAGDDYTIEEDYQPLSGIAPTLCRADNTGQDSWQTMTTRAGKALGRSAEAARLVASVTAAVSRTRRRYPGLRGTTFTVGPVRADGSIATVSRISDASAAFFAQLGMTLSPKVRGLPQSSIPGRSEVSSEGLDVIDADVLVLAYNTDTARKQVESNPLFRRLPAVQRGSYVGLDVADGVALGFPSVLSIPFSLENLVPKIAAAAART